MQGQKAFLSAIQEIGDVETNHCGDVGAQVSPINMSPDGIEDNGGMENHGEFIFARHERQRFIARQFGFAPQDCDQGLHEFVFDLLQPAHWQNPAIERCAHEQTHRDAVLMFQMRDEEICQSIFKTHGLVGERFRPFHGPEDCKHLFKDRFQ